MKQILWWLIAGSKGGINRARIIMALKKRPYNANQLTQLFGLDYKTVLQSHAYHNSPGVPADPFPTLFVDEITGRGEVRHTEVVCA